MPIVVPGKLVLLAVNSDDAILDPVGITSDCCAEIGFVSFRVIILKVIEAQDYIPQFPFTIGDFHRDYAPAEISYRHFHSRIVAQDI